MTGITTQNRRGNAIARTAMLVAIYVLLGNARSIQPNPFIEGAVIAVNMIVPVLSGALFGRWCGFLVGGLGTTLNAFSPGGSVLEFLAIGPHAVMGYSAGWLAGRFGPVPASAALIVGHVLNVGVFAAFGHMPAHQLLETPLWLGLASEAFAGIIAVNVIASLYRLCFEIRPS